MTNRLALFCAFLIWLTVVALVNLAFIANAQAHHRDIDITIYHDFPGPPGPAPEPTKEPVNFPTGAALTDSDLSQAYAVLGASGSHMMDFSTQQWQGSITGAWYDNENAISLGIGKRWEKLGKAMFHGNITQSGSETLYVIGSTFRF